MIAEAGIPIALKVASGAFLLVVIVTYWRAYGPSNFLWLSDIALACTILAIILENRLLASMPAVGVLPLEVAWTFDFLTGGRLIGLAAYMFDASIGRFLRGLSLFHAAIPPVLLVLLLRQGYDPAAALWEGLVIFVALILSYAFTDPKKNINWVFGPGQKPQRLLPPLTYLTVELAAIGGGVVLPMHFLLLWLFPAG